MELDYIESFIRPRVLVLGDLMVDTWLKGDSTRLSPEAPVPVVDISSNTSVLGGGANTAANLRHLGAAVTFMSYAGKDDAGAKAAILLEEAGIANRVLVCASRSTIVKTRIIAGSQMLTRYDEGTVQPLDEECEDELIALLEKEFVQHDAIVIADYNKGLITPRVIACLEKLQQQQHKFIAIDSKRLPAFRALQPSLVKPNYPEAVQLLDLPQHASNRAKQLAEKGAAVYAVTGAAITALTLDKEGALIFEKDQLCCHIPALQVNTPNVVGAGDTYISAFTLACLAEASAAVAAGIAASAAAVAISKTDTAHCKQGELIAHYTVSEKCITDLKQLENVCNIYRAQGKRIVFTNGCFDILHSGHVSYLNRAGELGDVLIIGTNSDDSIKRLKGNDRPINSLSDRMQVLAGLGVVTHIVPFGSAEDKDTPEALIRIVKPHVFAKGGDYKRETLPEAAAVEELGGEVVLVPLVPDKSTTLIIRRTMAKAAAS
jgi:D-beta-D-heptose 7-phosphate kinase / D-beta-D-heptose 1-phosphate adenosyltransferase